MKRVNMSAPCSPWCWRIRRCWVFRNRRWTKRRSKARRRFPAAVWNTPYRRNGISVHLRYGVEFELRMLLPASLPASIGKLVEPIRDRPIEDQHDLQERIRKIESAGQSETLYPDAEEYIQQQLFLGRIRSRIAEIRKNPAGHALRKELLKRELLPYQLDGIAFAVGAGRAILADEMGLGKTIQGIGVAELRKREAGIQKALVVCPASVKSQWCAEIRRFSDSSCRQITGPVAERARQYGDEIFLTVCNYEQVLRDILAIERVKWDLIVLDEGQRIKNWEAKTSRIMKSLRSPFARVLSGTPLGNRLDELFSVAEFIDALPLNVALPDASDLPFLEVAATAGACLVTGNVRRFPEIARRAACATASPRGVSVLSPIEALKRLARGDRPGCPCDGLNEGARPLFVRTDRPFSPPSRLCASARNNVGRDSPTGLTGLHRILGARDVVAGDDCPIQIPSSAHPVESC